ncbi:hypothetical protein [Rhodocista pekingensis]|uniref:Tetratricopeptide repeat protein n=1 Tax=Rhodocista pekingensis TaxID=201185 RepID=A0ABW2KZJ9_9PROT
MGDPLTLSVLGGWVVGGFIGNRSDQLFCAAGRKLQGLFFDGLREPQNRDLSRAIRRAQLLALTLTVKAYEKLPKPQWRTLPGYHAEDITTPLTTWIRSALVRDDGLEATLAGLAAEDAEAWTRRVDDVMGRIAGAFANPDPHDGPSAERQQQFRRLAEDWLLDEAKAKLTNSLDWPRFEEVFRGNASFAGWWPLFRGFLAEEVKTNEAVSRILTQYGIATLVEGQTDISTALDSVQAGQEAVLAASRDALADLRTLAGTVDAGNVRLNALLKRLDDIPSHILAGGIARDAGIRPVPAPGRVRFNKDRPTDLLLARTRAVPFLDFGGRKAELLSWATQPAGPLAERSVSGRLYIGEGGVGKTRLALALADDLKQAGWRVQEVRRDYSGPLVWRAFAPGPEASQGDLIIVDYAEARPGLLASLAAEAAEAAETAGPDIRILALARTAGDWWESIKAERGMEIFAPNAFPIGSNTGRLPPDQRRRLFETALAAFQELLAPEGLANPGGQSPSLDQDRWYDRPLLVLMAAYLTARGGAPESGEALFDGLLKEEGLSWKRVLNIRMDTPDDRQKIEALRRAVLQVTFLQGVAQADGAALLLADGELNRRSPHECLPVIEALTRLYPGDREDWIGALEPDVLGEYALAHYLTRFPRTGLLLLTATLSTPLAESGGTPARQALTVLQRMSHHPLVLCNRAAAFLLQEQEAQCQHLEAADLDRLYGALPDQTTHLRSLALAVERRRVALQEAAGEAGSPWHAGSLNNLGIRLSALGRREEALQATRKAVDHYTTLADSNPDAFLPDLAASLIRAFPSLRESRGIPMRG